MNYLSNMPHQSEIFAARRQQVMQMNTESYTYESIKRFERNQVDHNARLELERNVQILSQYTWNYPSSAPQTYNLLNNIQISQNLREVIYYISAITGWQFEPVLLSIIAAISMAARGRYSIRLDNAWIEALNIYVLISGISGIKKSATISYIKSPFDEFEERINTISRESIDRRNEQDKLLHMASVHARKITIREAYNNAKDDAIGCNLQLFFDNVKNSGAKIADLMSKYKVPKKHLVRLFTDSFTEKQLYHTMSKHGASVSICEAEGNSFVRTVNDKHFSPDIILKGYTGEKVITESKHDEVILNYPSIQILLIVQSAIMARIYGNKQLTDIGLTQRVLPWFISQVNPVQETYYQPQYQFYKSKICHMLERNYTQDSNKNILEISTSSDAYRMIKEFEKSNEQMFNTSASTYLESFTRKLHGSAARIAGLLHIWRHDEPEKYHVSLQDMESGVIIAKTILSHADYAFNPSGLCAFNDAIKIIEWQRRHRHYRFNSRDVGQGIRIDGNDRIYLALDLLERCHIITQAKVPGHPHLCAVHPTFA